MSYKIGDHIELFLNVEGEITDTGAGTVTLGDLVLPTRLTGGTLYVSDREFPECDGDCDYADCDEEHCDETCGNDPDLLAAIREWHDAEHRWPLSTCDHPICKEASA